MEVDGDDGTCTVVISLSQKNRRANNLALLTVGVCVYKVRAVRERWLWFT